MTAIDLPVIAFQIGLPIVLLIWLQVWPTSDLLGHVIQAVSTGLALLAVALTAIWGVPPWWVPIFYGAILLVIVGRQVFVKHLRHVSQFPKTIPQWLVVSGYAALGIYAGAVATESIAGRFTPETTVVELPLPLGPGTYLVANGGATQTVNAHFLTLNPETARQRDYRGQSFAVDLFKLSPLGNRAIGWRPRDPEAYAIFGEPVFAPCDGIVEQVADDMPDMPIPEPDTSRLEGNHVFLNCGEFGVLMAHFQSDSVLVTQGQRVEQGQPIARVGNSGQTFEPHLHLHAQELAKDGYHLSGKPLHVMLNGRYPVRNMRFHVTE